MFWKSSEVMASEGVNNGFSGPRFVMQEDTVQDLQSRVEKAVEVPREVASDVLEQYANSFLRLSAQDLY
jgi:hypothetical protein